MVHIDPALKTGLCRAVLRVLIVEQETRLDAVLDADKEYADEMLIRAARKLVEANDGM